MENFMFQAPTKIIFGKGTENQTGEEIKKFGKKVLLHYGEGSIKKYGIYDRVMGSLKKEGLEVIELGGVQPNPRLSMVRKGVSLCRENNIDFILAVGGGSAIDSAKAIGIGVPYSGDVWDFYAKKAKIRAALPIGAVLTIPAAGSEVSCDSVITNEDGWYKRSADSETIFPKFSILNPELTFTLSAKQTAIGIADIMSHVFERYFTQVQNVELTDRLAEATLKTLINNAGIVLENPNDYNARAEIMWCGSIAHNNLLGTGRINDWASHGIEHELSAIYDIAHGEGLSIVFPAWMKYVYKSNLPRFAQYANRVWNFDMDFNNIDKTAIDGINRLESFFREIGLATRLSDLDITDDRFDEMANKAVENGPIGFFKKLDKNDILNIFKIAL